MNHWGDIQQYDTLPKMLRANAELYGDTVALRDKEWGVWNAITWRAYARTTRHLALTFAELGVGCGDVVALLGTNGPYWLYGALAAHSNRAMSLGVYSDVLGDEVLHQLSFTQAKIVVVEDEEQADKLLSLGEKINFVHKIIYADARGMRKYDSPLLMSLAEALERGETLEKTAAAAALDATVAAADGDESALLIATSGTTATPKFAEVSHRAFLSHIKNYLHADPKTAADEYVSALPLPWIMETKYALGKSLVCRMKINFVESADTLMADLREIGPTFILLAPRVWEQLAGTVRARMLESTPLKRLLFNWGLRRGMAAVAQGTHSRFAEWLVFRALRDTLGFSRLSSAATGGAALGPDTYQFFIAMGVPLKQLYGQTELLGAYTIHRAGDVDWETSGVPFDDVDIKIVSPDAEGLGKIVARHHHMMKRYYCAPEETAKAIDGDGWMETGDAGYFKKNGHLVVIDRFADLAQTAAGVRFSPQYLENKLKFSPHIAEAVVLGNERDWLSVLVCIRFAVTAKWAEQRRIAFTNYTDLAAQEAVKDLIRGEIVAINATLPAAQRLRKCVLLHKELDADDGELTRTKKVRRNVVSRRYAEMIEAIYAGDEMIAMDTEITLQDGGKQRVHCRLEVINLAD